MLTGHSCYRAAQESSVTIIANINEKSDLDGKEKLREELGILEIQKEVHEQYQSKLSDYKALNERVLKLETELEAALTPLIVTEGKTDSQILEVARDKLYNDNDFPEVRFRCCDNSGDERGGGSGGASVLAKFIDTVHPDDGRKVIAIFDADEAGINAFKNLSKNFKDCERSKIVKCHKNGLAYAIVLPEPEHRSGYRKVSNLCIEYLFTDEILERPFKNGRKLQFRQLDVSMVVGGKFIKVEDTEVRKKIEQEAASHRKIGDGKEMFASEIVPTLGYEDFKYFAQLFDLIKNALQTNSQPVPV